MKTTLSSDDFDLTPSKWNVLILLNYNSLGMKNSSMQIVVLIQCFLSSIWYEQYVTFSVKIEFHVLLSIIHYYLYLWIYLLSFIYVVVFSDIWSTNKHHLQLSCPIPLKKLIQSNLYWVDPILSGHPQSSRHPQLSGQQSKSYFSFPTFTVKNTCIQRTPLLSRRGHLKLDFYGHFLIVRNLIKRTLQKECMIFFVHVLVAWSFKSVNKLSYHRNALFCYLFLQNFCSGLI